MADETRREYPLADLSPGELEAIGLAARGLSNAAIGRRMVTSSGTVNVLLNRAEVKLGALNKWHAVALAVQYGLIRVKPERGR